MRWDITERVTPSCWAALAKLPVSATRTKASILSKRSMGRYSGGFYFWGIARLACWRPALQNLRREWILGMYPIHCGSEPARESGVSGATPAECADAFASRLAPTVESG